MPTGSTTAVSSRHRLQVSGNHMSSTPQSLPPAKMATYRETGARLARRDRLDLRVQPEQPERLDGWGRRERKDQPDRMEQLGRQDPRGQPGRQVRKERRVRLARRDRQAQLEGDLAEWGQTRFRSPSCDGMAQIRLAALWPQAAPPAL